MSLRVYEALVWIGRGRVRRPPKAWPGQREKAKPGKETQSHAAKVEGRQLLQKAVDLIPEGRWQADCLSLCIVLIVPFSVQVLIGQDLATLLQRPADRVSPRL